MKNRSSLLIDSILIREADHANVGVPLTRNFRDDEEAIEGGYVHEIEPGLYHWVCVLDFKSMYPSIIIARNICFTTLSPNGTIVSPNGIRYLDKTQREGILPRILVSLMKERGRHQEEDAPGAEQGGGTVLRWSAAGHQDPHETPSTGVFASSFYRFTDKNIGSSITAFARETTKGIIASLEKESHHVIYSDTDSIFVQSPEPNLDGSKKFGSELAERFSGRVARWSSRRSWSRCSPTARRSATWARWSGPSRSWSSAATRPGGPTPSTCSPRRS